MREPPQIVKTHYVVGVRMGENHGIDSPDVRAQRLGAEICPGIYDKGAFWSLYIDRGAQSLIARI